MTSIEDEAVQPRPLVIHATTAGITLRAFFGGIPRALGDAGYDALAVSNGDEHLAAFAKRERCRVVSVPMARTPHPLLDLLAVIRLKRLFRQLRPTIVHTHTPKANLVGQLAARCAGVSHRIAQLHGLRFATASGAKRRLLLGLERLACRRATKVYAVSEPVREEALRCELAPEIGILGNGSWNGVEAERFRTADDVRPRSRDQLGYSTDDIVIGFVGRLVRDKGVDDLLAAWQSIKGREPRARLLLVGPLESADGLEPATLERIHSDDRVRLHGEDFDTPPLYAAMDIVTLPTYREGLPIVPLEASAAGRPLVVTDVVEATGAVRADETALVVATASPERLAAELLRLCGSTELRTRMGESARTHVQRRFSPELFRNALIDCYSSLV